MKMTSSSYIEWGKSIGIQAYSTDPEKANNTLKNLHQRLQKNTNIENSMIILTSEDYNNILNCIKNQKEEVLLLRNELIRLTLLNNNYIEEIKNIEYSLKDKLRVTENYLNNTIKIIRNKNQKLEKQLINNEADYNILYQDYTRELLRSDILLQSIKKLYIKLCLRRLYRCAPAA